MTRRRVAICSSLAALAATVALFVVMHEPAQSIPLPDGSTLRLVKTSYGRPIHFHLQGNVFDKLMFGWVPASWMTSSINGTGMGSLRKRFATAALRRSVPIFTPTNALAFWMQHTGVSPANSNCVFRIEAVDGNGAAWVQGPSVNRSFWKRSQTTPLLTGTVGVFDRRGERVHLRVLFFSNEVWQTAGEFSIRNPDRQRPPAWVAVDLPQAVQVDDDFITLRHFWTSSRSDPNAVGEIGVEFAMGSNSVSSLKWIVEKLALSDSTGNRWQGGGRRVSSDLKSETIYLMGHVPTNETLRLEASLVRRRDFKRDQTWEVRDVPLPLPGMATTVTNATATRDGLTIAFVSVVAENGSLLGGNGLRDRSIVQFSVSGLTNFAANSWRLSVVGVLDEKGRTIGHSYFPLPLAPSMRIPVTCSTGTSRATFVLALSQPTNVVFHARATQAP